MTIAPRRIAAAALAAVAPLAVISIATAAPSFAECGAGQSQFNGNCVASNCEKHEVRDADNGNCRDALSAALGKASPPAIAEVTPDQWGSAFQVAQQAGFLPGGGGGAASVGSALGIVNTAVDIPISVAAAASDTANTLYILSQIGGGVGAPQLPQPPNLGNPVDLLTKLPPPPPIGPPKLLGLCGPTMLFFTPCI